jgi:hypothetical protein
VWPPGAEARNAMAIWQDLVSDYGCRLDKSIRRNLTPILTNGQERFL